MSGAESKSYQTSRSTSPEASSLIANHGEEAQSWHTEKTLTEAGFDFGDLPPWRFRGFVDGIRRDDVIVRLK